MKHLILAGVTLTSLAVAGCQTNNPGPEIIGPEPFPTVKFIKRDSISQGDYRNISINSPTDEVFGILEQYRQTKAVSYVGAVNTYFSDVTDLKSRIHLFEWVVLDEKFDTESGVQLQLEAGKVKSVTLNNRRELTQWPETAASSDAVQIGDQTEVLYDKLVALSTQPAFAHKFERIVLTTRHTYALYDPVKASLPWRFVYHNEPTRHEEVQVHFKDKKVHYIIVNHFEKL